MLDSLKSLRRGVLVAGATMGLALGATAVAHAGGGHHGGHHGHHGHGHHGHGHHGHHGHHRFYRYRYYYTGGYSQCSYWRSECGSRWGFGTYSFGRCLWRHGC